jgi:K+/H+ antiporter YhaU regulatory subunit KhtT
MGVALALALRRFFIRIYAKAQIALKETLTKEKIKKHRHSYDSENENHQVGSKPELPFDHAAIQTILISSLNPFIGMAIRDTKLRSDTGCSVIAVRRANHTVLSPPPEWIFESEDEAMLLGSPEQLLLGRKLLEKGGKEEKEFSA